MAKINFSKLNVKKVNEAVKTINFNDSVIEVKQYLPIMDKLAIIGMAINNAADGNRFVNTLKLDIYLHLEIVFAYTNINFTDTQKSDLVKLYDLLKSSGLIDLVISEIPSAEYTDVLENAYSIADNMYIQMNSVYGIMDTIAKDYSEVGADATAISEELSNPGNLTFLKDIMSKLG